MTEPEVRISELEQKLARLEAKLTAYEDTLAQWAAGPGRKILRMLGVNLP